MRTTLLQLIAAFFLTFLMVFGWFAGGATIAYLVWRGWSGTPMALPMASLGGLFYAYLAPIGQLRRPLLMLKSIYQQWHRECTRALVIYFIKA